MATNYNYNYNYNSRQANHNYNYNSFRLARVEQYHHHHYYNSQASCPHFYDSTMASLEQQHPGCTSLEQHYYTSSFILECLVNKQLCSTNDKALDYSISFLQQLGSLVFCFFFLFHTSRTNLKDFFYQLSVLLGSVVIRQLQQLSSSRHYLLLI